jgi:hypothetical protein
MKNGRNTDGTFSKGNSGRPRGARNRKILAIQSLLEGQAEALTQTAISKALEGDSVALRLCLDRIMPARKDRCLEVHLPQIREPRDLLGAARVLILSVQTGELTPLEGDKVMALLERCQKLFASVELLERIEALEQKVMPS